MILSPEIITIELFDVLFLLFGAVAWIISIKILYLWNPLSAANTQYRLQKQAYLAATIIKFIFYVKILLFVFFIYTLNVLASLLPGAMCAAGVVNATVYGTPLVLLKILNLYFFVFWILIHDEDMQTKGHKYLKAKFSLYSVAFVLLCIEIYFEISLFLSLDVKRVVDCCGTIYSTTDNSYLANILALSHPLQLSIFYGLSLAILGAYIVRSKAIFALLNLLFLLVSLVTLISFFGTYIYELPTHHCPFCMLQKDYHYIGYFLYTVLFLGTFNGMIVGFIDFSQDVLKKRLFYALFFDMFYVVLVSYYPLYYYVYNHTWL